MTAKVSVWREEKSRKCEPLTREKTRKEESGALGGNFMQYEIVLALVSKSRGK